VAFSGILPWSQFRYRLLGQAGHPVKVKTQVECFKPRSNIDVGAVTKAGGYKLTDAAYAKLLQKLEGHYADMPQDLRSDILAFYQDLSLPIATKASSGDWARQEELGHLEAIDRDLPAASSKVSDAVGEQAAQ
jgi:hypothetical protein